MTNTLLPTVTATISLTLSASVSADIVTHWMGQRAGSPGTLAAAISATDTTLSLTSNARTSSLGFVTIAPGNSIVIDNEAMSVTAVDGSQITVLRNIVPLALPAQAHDAGALVSILIHPSAWAVIANEALRPWAQQVVAGLGANSATFGSQISGTLALSE